VQKVLEQQQCWKKKHGRRLSTLYSLILLLLFLKYSTNNPWMFLVPGIKNSQWIINIFNAKVFHHSIRHFPGRTYQKFPLPNHEKYLHM
jgi:hypothetical protein